MRMALRNLIRNRKLTLTAIAAVAGLTVFVLMYVSGIAVSQTELRAVYASMKVTAHIEGGTPGATPSMRQQLYEAIMDSGFVTHDIRLIQYPQAAHQVLSGIENPHIDALLEKQLPSAQWMEGYDASMFQSEQGVCLAPRAAEHQLGETLNFAVGGAETALQVVGLYGSSYPSSGGRTYYCPLGMLEAFCQEQGLTITYRGLELTLCRLDELDTFKAEMKALGLDSGTTRLVINDAHLQSVTMQLKRQLRLLRALLPVLLGLAAGIGFGLSFLLLRGRRNEAAILRSLGMRRGSVFFVLLLENAVQAAIGGLLGCAAALCLPVGCVPQPLPLAMLLLCYLLGGGAAAWRLSGVNVFMRMTEKE